MCSPKFHFFRCFIRTVKHATNTQVCHNGDVLTAECGITGFLPWVAGKQKAKQGLDAGSRSQGLALSNSPPEGPHSLESQQFLKQRHCLGTKLTLNNGRLELTPEWVCFCCSDCTQEVIQRIVHPLQGETLTGFPLS